MKTFEIAVKGRAIHANSADTRVVRTSVGIDQIHVLFDNAEWTDFPVKVTFANGNVQPVTTSLVLVQLDSTEWAAEATCTIPWEVIQVLGGIRITFQGTDSSGKHIITEASGTPLTVVEEGDVVEGSAPQPDPTVDEWHQAYADAMAAASDAASAAEQVAEILHSTDAQTLEELIAALGSAIRYKGSVATYADLPDDAEPGDMYNVAAAYGDYPAGTNWAWTVNETWDALGGEIDLSVFATKDSPALTGTPTAPTAATGTDTTQVATTAFVQQEIEAQDTATTTADGLMSSADKAKLDGIEAQANRVTAGDGLTLESGEMALGPLVQSGNPTHGCALYGVDAQGWAEQDGTPTPESPVPIEVCRGRNLLQVENGTYDTDYVTKLDNSARVRCMNPIPVKADETYALTLASDTGKTVQCVRAWLDASMSVIETSGWSTTTSVTPPANAAYVVAIFRYSDQSAINASDVKLQFELGPTPTPYVPYGHVGLEVQREDVSRVVFDGSSDEGWNLSAGVFIVDTPADDAFRASSITGTYAWCDLYTTAQATNANMPDRSIKLSNTQSRLTIKDSRYATVAEFTAALAANPITVYYLNDKHEGAVPDFPVNVEPIPLPSKGWAGGLPDGTADALSVDSAGGYEWTNGTDEVVFDGSSDEGFNLHATVEHFFYTASIVGPDYSSREVANSLCDRYRCVPYADTTSSGNGAFGIGTPPTSTARRIAFINEGCDTLADFTDSLAANPVTLLYKLATPTTENGYIDLPALPDGASVDIPELTALGVEWWVKGADAVVEHAANMARRNEEIEDAIAELAARVAALES